MNLKETIDKDLVSAMKEGNELKRDVLRSLKTQITNWQIAKLKNAENDDIIMIIKTAIKQREESAEQFELAKRPELAEKERNEAKILLEYLPTQLSETEITSIIDNVISSHGKEQNKIGAIMNDLKSQIGTRANMSKIAAIVKSKLA